MKILLLLSIITIVILLIGKKVINLAKTNLFKDQAAWSGNDIKINHNSSRQANESKGKANYLKMIADESKIYLDDQSEK